MTSGQPAQGPTETCGVCATALTPAARYCASCGAPVLAAASQVASHPDALGVSSPHLHVADTAGPPERAPKSPLGSAYLGKVAQESADPLIGQVVADRYRILSLLGRGGMGVVYKVEHTHIGKLMAMKLLSGQLAADPNTVRRFRREAKAVSKLVHPNTVQTFDFGESAKLVYLVMEYLPGRDLGSLSSAGPLPFARVAKICAQVAASVGEAHDRGIVHRDIKPENVMILEAGVPGTEGDVVKVLDFGIAKLRDAEELAAATQAGTILGTPYFMAPEQIKGEAVDHRADIYALGAVMYKAVSGVPPFVSQTPMGVLTMHLTRPLVSVRVRAPNLNIPKEADAIIDKAMQKDPSKRYQSMEELREDLLQYLVHAGELESSAVPRRSQGFLAVLPRAAAVATRMDVDRYERALRRTHWLGRAVAIVLAGVAAYGAYALLEQRPTVGLSSELEPNNEPAQANALKPGSTLTAYLGRRTSELYSDADVYAIDLDAQETRVADIAVTALPNMDLVLELVRKGQSTPLLIADSGGVGEPERVPNVTLRGGVHYVRVRERWQAGQRPTENVSDPYTITARFVSPSKDQETELNDTLEAPERLVPNVARTGLVGWAGDHDVYCFARPKAAMRVQLSAAGSLDLVLTLVDRSSRATRVANAHGAQHGEEWVVPASGAPGELCVEVRAADHPGLPRADPDHPYTLELVPR